LLQHNIEIPQQRLCSNDNTDAYSNKILSLKKETIFSLLNLREMQMRFLCSDLNSPTPRQCAGRRTQAYAEWNRMLSAKQTAARDRTAAAHEKQAPFDAHSSAPEAGAPEASPLMPRTERQPGRQKCNQMDTFLSDGRRQDSPDCGLFGRCPINGFVL
jgi:hypothetical protein